MAGSLLDDHSDIESAPPGSASMDGGEVVHSLPRASISSIAESILAKRGTRQSM